MSIIPFAVLSLQKGTLTNILLIVSGKFVVKTFQMTNLKGTIDLDNKLLNI
jgi:hypothetical protein